MRAEGRVAGMAYEPGPDGPSASHENLREAGFERTYVRHDWLPPREAPSWRSGSGVYRGRPERIPEEH